MIVLESPGKNEDDRGIPAIGKAGKRLSELLETLDIQEDTEVYITNVVKCRSYILENNGLERDVPPHMDVIRECSWYLEREIEIVQPKLLILAGGVALKWWLDRTSKAAVASHDMKDLNTEGKRFGRCRPKVFTTYHPAAVVRDETRLTHWISQWQAALDALEGVESAEDGKYHLHTDDVQLTADFEQRLRSSGVLACDVETTGLNLWDEDFKTLWVAAAICEGECFVVRPTQQTALWDLLADPMVTKVGHFLSFDIHALRRSGFVVQGPLFDTGVAAYLLDNSRPSLSLESLAMSELRASPWKSMVNFDEGNDMTGGEARIYAGKDGDMTLRLKNHYARRLEEEGLTLLFQKKMEVLSCLNGMEAVGVKVDMGFHSELSERFSRKLEARRQELVKMVRRKNFNPNSPKQVGEILYGKLGIPEQRKKGKLTTNHDTLESLKNRTYLRKDQREIVRAILEYRPLAKLQGTYVEGMRKHVKSDGKIHCRFNLTRAATRLSSSNPNLQNIPARSEEGKLIRKLFVSSFPGGCLLALDYSQIELRVFALLANQPTLMRAFAEGIDIHRMTAATVFGKSFEEVTDQERYVAKTTNFGILYGASPERIASEAGLGMGEAEFVHSKISRMFDTGRYTKELVRFLNKHGYVEDLFGQRRMLPPIKGGPFTRDGSEMATLRQAVNAPTQCTAHNILCFAMVELKRQLRERRFRSRLVINVHDEVVLDCPNKEEAFEAALLGIDVMQDPDSFLPPEWAKKLTIPLLVDAEYGRSWGKMEPISSF